MATWCVEAWEEIQPSLIIKSFISTGMTNPEMYGDEVLNNMNIHEPLMVPEDLNGSDEDDVDEHEQSSDGDVSEAAANIQSGAFSHTELLQQG